MTAGLNLLCNVVRITDQADDAIGGAQPSGTVVYERVPCRITARKSTQVLLEQGLETPTIFTAILSPASMDIDNNDQIEVIWPQQSFHYGHRFIVVSVSHPSMSDGRGYLVCSLRRFEKAHSNLLM